MIVVAVAMLGSLTVLPALLSKLGDQVEKGRIPFLGRLRRERGENRVWATVLTPALRHPVVTVVAVGRRAPRARPAGAPHPHRADRARRAAEEHRDRRDARQDPDRVPRRRHPALVAIKAQRRLAAAEGSDRLASPTQALATGQMTGADRGRRQPGRTVARVAIPLGGNGTDATSHARAAHAPRPILPATIGTVAGRDLRGHRRHGGLGRRERAAQALGAARVRLRAHVRVHPAARLVPLDRDRGEGDRRSTCSRSAPPTACSWSIFQYGLGREPAELPLERRDRVVAADLHVRDPVRPLDGLPRLHPEPRSARRTTAA